LDGYNRGYDLHSITVDGRKSIPDITNLVLVEKDLVIRSSKFGKQFIYFEVKSSGNNSTRIRI
jgi:hypothetical protein